MARRVACLKQPLISQDPSLCPLYVTFIPKFSLSILATACLISCDCDNFIGVHAVLTAFVPNANVIALPSMIVTATRGSTMALRSLDNDRIARV